VDESDFGMRVTFGDNSEAIYSVPAAATSSASWSLVVETGSVNSIPGLEGAVGVSFGLPAFSGGAESHLVKLGIGPGGITAADDVALVSGTTLLAQKGTEAPDSTGAPLSGVVFETLSDPVCGSDGAVAFEAALAGAGVNAGNNTGIWFAADGATPKLSARSGDPAPGGGHFGKFVSMVLPDYKSGAGGPIFVATLALSSADNITGENNLGVWAVDGSGAPQLLFHTGQSVTIAGEPRTVATFLALAPAPGSLGAASGYDEDGDVSILATFTDGTEAVVNVAAP
jgi:hypothetical protein